MKPSVLFDEVTARMIKKELQELECSFLEKEALDLTNQPKATTEVKNAAAEEPKDLPKSPTKLPRSKAICKQKVKEYFMTLIDKRPILFERLYTIRQKC